MDKNVMRFVLDLTDCSEGGDACKATMRPSVAGAFVYFSELEALDALNATQAESIKEFRAQQKEMRSAIEAALQFLNDSEQTFSKEDSLIAILEAAITPEGDRPK